MTIYLLRHGHIVSDPVKRFIGQQDLPLSARGVAQAHRWRKALSSVRFDAVFASDLARSRETACIITGNKEAAVSVLPAFREISLGSLEGRSMEEVQRRQPDLWHARGKDLVGFRPTGGESFSDLSRRVLPAFDAIVRAYPENRHVLISAHAGVNRVILCHVLGMPMANLFRIAQDHGCMNTLAIRSDGVRVLGLNLH